MVFNAFSLRAKLKQKHISLLKETVKEQDECTKESKQIITETSWRILTPVREKKGTAFLLYLHCKLD